MSTKSYVEEREEEREHMSSLPEETVMHAKQDIIH